MDEKNNDWLAVARKHGYAFPDARMEAFVTEVLATRATQASSAPGGEAVAALAAIEKRMELIYSLCCSTAPKQSVGELVAVTLKMPEWGALRAQAAHPAAAPDSAQQGEDEPPLPEDFGLSLSRDDNRKVEAYARQYARTYHAHMMRKLGDGVKLDRNELIALIEAVIDEGYGVKAPLTKTRAFDRLATSLDAKLAQARAAGAYELRCAIMAMVAMLKNGEWAEHISTEPEVVALESEITKLVGRAAGAERAVPEGWKRATGDAAASGWAWDYQWLESLREQVGGDIGMEEIDALLTVLAAAPSPAAAKEGADAGALALACVINKKLGDVLAGRAYLLPSDLAALKRFHECATDFDSGGHDVPKDVMARLREIGVMQSLGFGRHQTTAFGDYVLERDAGEPVKLPLKTLVERNEESRQAALAAAQQDSAQVAGKDGAA